MKHEYGDVAQVVSTYVKHFHGDDQILGRGINAISMVRRDGRWWIFVHRLGRGKLGRSNSR